ncbi:NADPH-dependent F420 reductase [Ancylobacter defluvii]|uniref:NADP oxidoreductase n=1 Tax=Ancylobacter defluvii TaxID=1282440 RepID=A0A9W6JVV4_9HYPH|nr:NADPH-dependent F420 reductase [Ancylobacter defluvii]MBS7590185.1 NADPH-dependent F420 reductase [Ancylobacter defluvii]GLK82819.1 NADP oxidoreductase [Ancylobacter defluvii]
MTYAIIGAGAIGTALARQFARKSIPVKIANSRGPDSLAPLVSELGANIQPAELSEALAADIVILAVPFTAVEDTVKAAGPWNGRIVVDATNAINFNDFSPADLGGRLSSEIVSEAVTGARLVKAFNTLPAAVLAQVPDGPSGRRTIFVSSNDAAASTTVAGLADSLGFAAIELGKLAEGGRLQQFGGALMVHSLIKQG